MLSAIFVDRPRLAIVIAIVTTIAGLLAPDFLAAKLVYKLLTYKFEM